MCTSMRMYGTYISIYVSAYIHMYILYVYISICIYIHIHRVTTTLCDVLSSFHSKCFYLISVCVFPVSLLRISPTFSFGFVSTMFSFVPTVEFLCLLFLWSFFTVLTVWLPFAYMFSTVWFVKHVADTVRSSDTGVKQDTWQLLFVFSAFAVLCWCSTKITRCLVVTVFHNMLSCCIFCSLTCCFVLHGKCLPVVLYSLCSRSLGWRRQQQQQQQ